MCRNIKLLHHFEPPASPEEIRDSALQYVRKLTGMRAPSRANQQAFDRAVEEVTEVVHRLFDALEVNSPPRSRETERQKAMERGRKREEQIRARILGQRRAPRVPGGAR
ncbi:MAG TPA: DUF2277 domain-containing protein [Myxococcaceae bacterium]|nr:DUF2277 domain-containing protein [Myxococcaceae bacterium]